MADEIRIELVADADGVVRAVQKVVPAAKKAGKKAAENIEGPFNKAAKVIKNNFVQITAAVAALTAGKKFIDAAAQQDAAVQKLNTSLRNMGEFSQETSRSLQDFASALQAQSTVGDEVILDQLAFAQAMGASVDQSKEILSAAADMSAALGVDLNSSVRNISKTLGGYAGELGEVIPELKNLTQEQLKNGEGIALLASRYDGFAKAETKTFNGAMTQLSNTIGDAFERIGDIIVQSPVVIKAFNGIAKIVSFLIEKFDPKPFTRFVEFIIIGAAQIADTFSFLVYPFEALYKGAIFAFDAIKTGAVTMAAGVLTAVTEMVDMLPSFAKKFLNLEGLQEAKDGAVQLMTDLGTETRESFDNMFTDYSFSDQIVGNLETFAESLRNVDESTETSVNKIKTGLDDAGKSTESFKETADKAFSTVNQMVRNTMTKTISQGIQSMISSLMTGENGMADFGKFVLGMFGQLAIQMGEFFIAQGIAQMALISNPFTAPAAMIAAGAGLIALGAIISSLGGTSGGGSSQAASGAGAGGAAGTGGIMDTGGPLDEVIAEDEPSAIEKQQQVQLVVQGDILDSEETGTRLLSILNDEFDAKGGRIAYA